MTLPQKLVSIKDSAFAETAIETITFPATLKCIGSYAFGSSKLTNIMFEDNISNLEEIEYEAFISTSLNNIPKYMIENCTKIGNKVFASSQLKELTLFAPVEYEGTQIFSNNPLKAIKLINNKNKWTVIKNGMFNSCTFLETIEIPDTIKHLESCCFHLTGISEFYGPSSLISIEKGTFADCGNLTSIDLSKTNIQEIPEYVFPVNEFDKFVLPTFLGEFNLNSFCGSSIAKSKVEKLLKNNGNPFVVVI